MCVYVYIHTATPSVHLVHLAHYSNLFRFLLSLSLLAPCWWKLPSAICVTSWSSVQVIDNKKSVLLGFSPCSCCNASFSGDLVYAGWLLQVLATYFHWWFYLEPQRKSNILVFCLSIHTFGKGFETICGHAWYTVFLFLFLFSFF